MGQRPNSKNIGLFWKKMWKDELDFTPQQYLTFNCMTFALQSRQWRMKHEEWRMKDEGCRMKNEEWRMNETYFAYAFSKRAAQNSEGSVEWR